MKKPKYNLRIIRKIINKKSHYSVHEVEYDSKNRPAFISFHPVTLSMYEKKELNKEFRALQKAFKSPILNEEDIIKNGQLQ